MLRLADEKAALLSSERGLEARVLEALSTPLRNSLPSFLQQARAVESFDLALAGARLAREAGLTRPVLHDGEIRVERGRHLPTEALCQALDTPYAPLDATFDGGPAVLFGSNMGGKTVVLKTLAFLQLAAQAGLFVPATRFVTRVFRRFHYVGEGRSREEGRGLSGFGFEIRQFNEAHADFGDETLALFDELARTTSSGEAEALLSAVLEELSRHPRVVALFSTHFRGVRRLPGVRYLRMGGLDRSHLDLSGPDGPDDADLASRIRRIDRLMRFCLEPDVPGQRSSDAITVARLLGLSPALAGRAEGFIHDEE
jgi:DNA mismatch repair ATPase MutS